MPRTAARAFCPLDLVTPQNVLCLGKIGLYCASKGYVVASHPSEQTIKIDTENILIRVLLPVLTIGAMIGTHIGGLSVLNRALPNTIDPLCVLFPLDVVVFVVGGLLIDRALKRLWPLHRHATLSEEALVLTDRRKQPPQITRIAWGLRVNVRAWRFTVKRPGRIPRGWYCMALRLLQDEDEAIFYTFMARKEAEKLPDYANFVRLRSRKETLANPNLEAAAEQRRLLKLEDARWEDGAEVSREDFAAILHMLRQHVEAWN